MFPFHPCVWIAVGFSAIPIPDKTAAQVKEFNSAQRTAVDKGMTFLRKGQAADGTWHHLGQPPQAQPTEETIGTTALCAYAMVDNGGASFDDPHVVKATAAIRARVADLITTQTIALSILFLDRISFDNDDTILLLAGKLLQGQHMTGGWGKHCPRREGEAEDGYNTFHAVLALNIARRHNVKVSLVLPPVEKYYRENQQKDGGWGLRFAVGPDNPSTPAMTCAGLLGLAYSYRKEWIREAVFSNLAVDPSVYRREPKVDPQIRRARDFLAKHLAQSPRPELADPFFLWTLDRICMIYGQPHFNGIPWYEWGAKALLSVQQANGSWTGGTRGSYHNTALALLFVRKPYDDIEIEGCEFPLPPKESRKGQKK